MLKQIQRILDIPTCYHYIRQILLLGMPLKAWASYGNYDKSHERIADLGCGPSDILRYVNRDHMPAFYLGIDISDRYLRHARAKAAQVGIDSKFLTLDLSMLKADPAIRLDLLRILNDYQITTVNLFGVLHHIDDAGVISTLNTLYDAPSIKSLNTEDVLWIKSNIINNFYASLDRGTYVREEQEYDALISQTKWKSIEKVWSHAGVWPVKYLHYRLSK